MAAHRGTWSCTRSCNDPSTAGRNNKGREEQRTVEHDGVHSGELLEEGDGDGCERQFPEARTEEDGQGLPELHLVRLHLLHRRADVRPLRAHVLRPAHAHQHLRAHAHATSACYVSATSAPRQHYISAMSACALWQQSSDGWRQAGIGGAQLCCHCEEGSDRKKMSEVALMWDRPLHRHGMHKGSDGSTEEGGIPGLYARAVNATLLHAT